MAVVTGGAGKAIGGATSARFAREGARVVILDVDAASGEAVVADIRRAGGHAILIPTDVTDPTQVSAAVNRTVERFGRIDVLACVAGRAREGDRDLLDASADDLEAAYRDNTVSAALCSRAVLPHMLGAGYGRVAYVSSLNVSASCFGQICYAMAKASLSVLARGNTVAYFRHGVGFNVVVSGTVPSDKPSWLERRRQFPELLPALAGMVPAGRLGTPLDVASALLFLASEESSWISGAELVVDGGWLAAAGPFTAGDWRQQACLFKESGLLDRLGELDPHHQSVRPSDAAHVADS